MNRTKIFLGLGVLCVLILGIIFISENKKVQNPDNKKEDTIRSDEEEFRQLQSEISEARADWMRENGGMPDPEGEVYAKGKTIQISREEFELGLAKYKAEGKEEIAQENIIKGYAKNKILYGLATEKGYTITDDEVKQEIENAQEDSELYREMYGIDSPIAIEMKAFGSEQEYWDAVYDTYKGSLLIKKYTSDLKEQKAAEWGLEDDYFGLEEKWFEYYEEYTDQLIAEEDIRIL